MGKSKRQKTAHENELTQAEIWDDSALIQSWDAAVEEYELYHSIAAKGEDVEDVLRRAELGKGGKEQVQADGKSEALDASTASRSHILSNGREQQGEDFEDGEIEDEEEEDDDDDDEHPLGKHQYATVKDGIVIGAASKKPATVDGEEHRGANTEESSSPEQTLENIKMAYYWAGYYSGLYDGQRQRPQKPDAADMQ